MRGIDREAAAGGRRLLGKFFLAVTAAFTVCLLGSGPASAAPQLKVFHSEMSSLQAGSHPDDLVTFGLLREDTGRSSLGLTLRAVVGGPPKNVVTVLPAGVAGNPAGFETCTPAELTYYTCPVSAQVGATKVGVGQASYPVEDEEAELELTGPPAAVYNMEPERGEVARLGFRPLGSVNAYISIKLRPSDYRLVATVANISDIKENWGASVATWGSPAAPSHDGERPCFRAPTEPGCSANIVPKPFFTLGADCSAESATEIAVDTWTQPGDFARGVSEPIRPTGCDRLSFHPSLDVAASTSSAGSPSGLDIDLSFPQHFDNPNGLETPPLRRAVVTLPEGMSINPSSADGLQSCTDAELGAGTDQPLACPAASKIGTVEASTPVLDEGVSGGVYLLSQNSNDPASGEMYRIALVLENAKRGISVRLPGQIKVDPDTGRLQATVANSPQLPVSDVSVRLKSGPRSPLVMPQTCGEKAVTARLTSWSGQSVSLTSDFSVNSSCDTASQFTPGFSAGTVNPIGGGYSPFTLRVTRPDGQQNVSTIQATLPEGVLAKLAGVQLCGDSDAATGNCPASSQLGTATVGTGAGSNPLYVPQPGKAPTAVYLAGPYKGAPYSLVAKVPAQAGPFDLGTVAVRNTIDVDPTSAQVSVKSDPLPQVLGGIPISYRDIRVDVDRSDFTLNPTSCDPMEVRGVIGSANGQSANVSDRFQAANCERLAFKPKLSLRLSGAPTRRGGYPKLRAVLTMPQHGANIQRAQVLLPKTEFLENAHIRTICTRVQYAAGNGGGKACPKASVYGYAKAWSPLLDQPIQGPVYLRSSNHKLPDLVAALDGQIHIDLVGRIDAVHARIRNTFETVPDAPVSRFVLTMQGGKKGLLVNNTNICRTKPRANVRFDGQNGKLADSKPVTRVACKKGQRKQVRHRRR